MKIVVIGGSGPIGSKLVTQLRERGDEAVPASPSLGINSITGEGLAEARVCSRAVSSAQKWPRRT
jgi:nucleoside-diphosphate-sugar epimerase